MQLERENSNLKRSLLVLEKDRVNKWWGGFVAVIILCHKKKISSKYGKGEMNRVIKLKVNDKHKMRKLIWRKCLESTKGDNDVKEILEEVVGPS